MDSTKLCCCCGFFSHKGVVFGNHGRRSFVCEDCILQPYLSFPIKKIDYEPMNCVIQTTLDLFEKSYQIHTNIFPKDGEKGDET